jgi:hypothetical protein
MSGCRSPCASKSTAGLRTVPSSRMTGLVVGGRLPLRPPRDAVLRGPGRKVSPGRTYYDVADAFR